MFLHIGSDVQFKILSNSADNLHRESMTWTSSNPRVLDINSIDGSAVARQEGKADIMISDSINAVSIVHVSKVKHAELD